MTDSSPPLHHVIESAQFQREGLESLIQLTDGIRRFGKTQEGLLYLKRLLRHKRVMLYFTQPSTRTFLSFQSACDILGASTCEIRDSSISSERKGESIEDSLRTFSSYVDMIIMRSPVAGLCMKIANLLDGTPRPVPVINAGSGPDEHPTQALLDLYTLHQSFGKIDGLALCLVGDLNRGRTIRSLTRLLMLFDNIKLILSSPTEFAIADDLRQQLASSSVEFVETTDFEEVLPYVDVVYMTRIQDEYDQEEGDSSTIDISPYRLSLEQMAKVPANAVILHPMPRRDELDWRIDSDPRARYWRQERNGMWIRAALIAKIFGVHQNLVLPEL